jgi:hypothetical protein
MVTLPAAVNPDGAEARFRDGILELTLPKAEQALPRQIKVSGAGQGAASSAPSPAPTTGGANGTDAAGHAPGTPSAPGATSTAGAGTVQPTGSPTTPDDKDQVTQSSEESMGTSDPPSWTQERT